MGDRHDRHAELRIKLHDAVFVGRLVARRAPRAFRIDDQLARIARQFRLVAAITAFSALERLPRSTGIMRIFMMYQPKNGIHCSSRFKM